MNAARNSMGIMIRVAVAVVALGFVLAAVVGGVSWPAFFMALASTALLLALAAMYQSFRGVFGDRSDDAASVAVLPERAALLDEKNALLRAIKDIAFEHQVGKLSDQEFERLDRAYRLRAKAVLRKLDEDLAPYFAEAERILDGALAAKDAEAEPKQRKKDPDRATPARRECVKCGTSNAAAAEWCKECGARIVPIECGACGAMNEPDSKFCMKCASPVASQPSGARQPEPGTEER